MKRSLIVFSDPENSCLKPISMREFKRILDDFGQGAKLSMTLENYRRKRSLSQNNLLHLYLGVIENETGESSKRLKEIFKMQYGVKEPLLDKNGKEMVDEYTGEIQKYFVSTADYTTEQMSAFIEKIIRWTYEFYPDIILPDPEDAKNNNIRM